MDSRSSSQRSVRENATGGNKFVTKKKQEWSAAKSEHGFSTAPPNRSAPTADNDTAKFRVVHPYGFKILKNTSAIERSLQGYFRLPPAPSKEVREERERLHRELMRIERGELLEQRQRDINETTTLDGFLLLNASGCDNPEEVESVTLQKMNLSESVPEDLTYFPQLFFLDVSENRLHLEDLLPLSGLEILHLAYNQIDSLRGVEEVVMRQQELDNLTMTGEGEGMRNRRQNELSTTMTSKSSATHDVLLPRLTALNMSCNLIPTTDLPILSYFPSLEKLDLSSNFLNYLPPDLSFLSSVTHFALENNQFTSKNRETDVFFSLSTMPSLVEVNLNNNSLSHVFPLSVEEGSGLCFPSIEVIGLSGNQFKKFPHLASLGKLHRTLKRIVLSKNPICSDQREITKTKAGFDEIVLDSYYERDKRTKGTKYKDNEEDIWNNDAWERFLPNEEESKKGVSSAAAAAASAFYSDEETVRTNRSCAEKPFESTATSFVKTETNSAKSISAEDYLALHHIELVFSDMEMPKRSVRDFYSSKKGGQSSLVTVPNYKEFMDIYRIVGTTREEIKAPLKGPLRSTKAATVSVRPPPTLPESESESESEEFEEFEEEVEEEVTDDEEEKEDGGDFFITGVDDIADRPKKTVRTTIKVRRRVKRKEKPSPTSYLDSSEVYPQGSTTVPNAHNAVSELRNLLRKPLPHLPYSGGNNN